MNNFYLFSEANLKERRFQDLKESDGIVDNFFITYD